MGVKGMWRSNAVTLTILIFLNLGCFSLGTVPWIILGLLVLGIALFMMYRTGMGIGHEACGIAATLDAAEKSGNPRDPKLAKEAWSKSNGIKAYCLSVLIPYALACLYIICSLLNWTPMILPTRIAAWVLALPFWPFIAYWYTEFTALTPAIVVILLASPFVLPLSLFLGYMQGPKLWKKTEEAMAQGLRRARAKSRIVRKKRTPKEQKPMI